MSTYSSLVADYLGSGLASGRPASLNLFPGSVGFYYATDTNMLSMWNGAWFNYAPTLSFAGGLTAAGTTQGTAYQLTTTNAQFTTVAAGTGTILTALAVGTARTLINDGANVLTVYPVVGQNFTGLAANAPVQIQPGGSATFWQVTSTGVSVR